MTTRNTRTNVEGTESRGLSPKERPPKAWNTSKPPGGKATQVTRRQAAPEVLIVYRQRESLMPSTDRYNPTHEVFGKSPKERPPKAQRSVKPPGGKSPKGGSKSK